MDQSHNRIKLKLAHSESLHTLFISNHHLDIFSSHLWWKIFVKTSLSKEAQDTTDAGIPPTVQIQANLTLFLMSVALQILQGRVMGAERFIVIVVQHPFPNVKEQEKIEPRRTWRTLKLHGLQFVMRAAGRTTKPSIWDVLTHYKRIRSHKTENRQTDTQHHVLSYYET